MTEVNFQFAHPGLLVLLALLPILAWLKGRTGQVAALGFPSVAAARDAGAKIRNKAGGFLATLRLLALGALIIALARPQLGKGTTEVEASGIDIILAIDVSGSMEALDFQLKGNRVNRLEVVKDVVARFVEDRPNDRIGILAFAGRPYLVSPLTLDHDWLLRRLESVKIGQVEDGTAIGSAIVSAANHLKEQEAKSRIVVLLTDGMNNSGAANPATASEAAKAFGIKIYTVGAGTRGQAPMPMRTQFGGTRLRMVEVDIDEEALRAVADQTGGQYFRATDTDSLEQVYEVINKLETTKRKLKKYENVDEWFLFALVPAIFFLGLERLLGETRLRRLP
ncbi:MAG: VWA domain-containing protein [Verrucomicrobiales bacterium]|nr:VWA domain-containing protein [Verrucomicrobiales bacterium]